MLLFQLIHWLTNTTTQSHDDIYYKLLDCFFISLPTAINESVRDQCIIAITHILQSLLQQYNNNTNKSTLYSIEVKIRDIFNRIFILSSHSSDTYRLSGVLLLNKFTSFFVDTVFIFTNYCLKIIWQLMKALRFDNNTEKTISELEVGISAYLQMLSTSILHQHDFGHFIR